MNLEYSAEKHQDREKNGGMEIKLTAFSIKELLEEAIDVYEDGDPISGDNNLFASMFFCKRNNFILFISFFFVQCSDK
jgi:hypothetical protein